MATGVYERTEFHRRRISEALSGEKHPNWGKKRPREVVEKMSRNRMGKCSGSLNSNWKGEDVGYIALHIWVKRWKSNPVSCDECNKIGEKVHGRWNIHWANKSGKYIRHLNDWIPLCRRCHYYYD